MAARNPSSNSSSNLIKIVSAVVIVAAIGAGIYFYMQSEGSSTPTATPTPAKPATATNAAPNTAAPAAEAAAQPAVPDLTPEQLMKEASTAFREQRLVAPPGNNALEYYLSLLDKQPNNVSARDALREMFPIVTGAVEQDINAGALDEGTRVINLLAKADPNNYTLTILRSKLDARKKVIDREDAQKAEAQKSAEAQRAAATAAANANNAQNAASTSSTPATPGEAATAGTAATPKPASATATPAAATAATATPPPAATAAPASAGGESHGAEVVKTTAPEYPPDAARKHQEGWVEVEFTITADGQVAGATVVNANPARVFNASAIRAVQSWTFRPRVDNGKPVDEKMRRRIEFRLSG